jgi:hypothetical protein
MTERKKSERVGDEIILRLTQPELDLIRWALWTYWDENQETDEGDAAFAFIDTVDPDV